MRRSSRVCGTVAAIAVGAAAAACGDSTGIARDYEPELTVEVLEDGLQPITGSQDLLLSLDLITGTLDWYGASGLAFRVAPRIAPEGSLGSALSREARPAPAPSAPWSGGASVRAPGDLSALQWPPGVRGETFVWDPVDGYVPSGWGGAPADGVRFLLYRMDSYDGYPETPLVETGHVDLLASTTAAGDVVRVRAVRTAGPDRVIADYAVETAWSGGGSEGGLEITAEGFIGNEAVVEMELAERYSWSAASDRYDLEMDYRLRRGSTRIDMDVAAEGRYDAVDWDRFELDTRFSGVGPVVDLRAEIRGDGRLDGEIRSDGKLAIRIGGHDGSPWFERADDRPLSWEDEDALDRLWTGVTDLLWWVDWVLVPEELLYE